MLQRGFTCDVVEPWGCIWRAFWECQGVIKDHCGVFQHWEVFKEISEVFILVPALLGLKGNLEMTLASRLSTAVSGNLHTHTHTHCTEHKCKKGKVQLILIYTTVKLLMLDI